MNYNLEDIQEVLEQSVKGMFKQHKIDDFFIWQCLAFSLFLSV